MTTLCMAAKTFCWSIANAGCMLANVISIVEILTAKIITARIDISQILKYV
jgi:hypothetical protein